MHVPYTGCNPRGLMLARGKDLSKTLVHYHRIPVPAFAVFPKRRKVRASGAAGVAADRQEPERGRLLRHLAGLRRRQRREARRARRLHPRAGRHGGDRRAIYRRPRNLCRRARQRPPARAAGLGAGIRQNGPSATGRSPPRRSSTIPIIRSAAASCRARRRIWRPNSWRASSASPSGSTGRWNSTAMPASISGSPPTARRISSRPIPIRKSPKARSSPRRRSMTGSNTAMLLHRGFSRSASSAAAGRVSERLGCTRRRALRRAAVRPIVAFVTNSPGPCGLGGPMACATEERDAKIRKAKPAERVPKRARPPARRRNISPASAITSSPRRCPARCRSAAIRRSVRRTGSMPS